MFRWIVIGLLSVSVIAVGIWGYQEHQEKNDVLIQAENNYQKSFHNLTYHMDMLHDKIGTALAMNSEKSLSPQMIEIWRLTSESLSDVGHLPLILLPFNKTKSFLADIGEFTYQTSVRDLEAKPLTKKETKKLEKLHSQAADVKDDLRQVQHSVLENDLRWMDVQLALATKDDKSDNTIIDGFKTVEKTVSNQPEENMDMSMNNRRSQNDKYKSLPDKTISKDEARKKSLDIFSLKNSNDLTVTKSGDGADTPIYSVSYKEGNNHGYMDMTQKGGHPLHLLVDRPLGNKHLSLNQGMKKAKQYLDQFDFNDMTVFKSSEYEKTGVYSFLCKQDGVRVFPDAVEVKVALDNGDILGLTAQNYFMNHHERTIPEPDMSVEEASKHVNENVDIQEKHLALIENNSGKEVLTHEFIATKDSDTYRIFINAMDGTEERVKKLGETEINYEGLS